MLEAPKLANRFVDFSVVFANDSKSRRGVWGDMVVLSCKWRFGYMQCPLSWNRQGTFFS